MNFALIQYLRFHLAYNGQSLIIGLPDGESVDGEIHGRGVFMKLPPTTRTGRLSWLKGLHAPNRATVEREKFGFWRTPHYLLGAMGGIAKCLVSSALLSDGGVLDNAPSSPRFAIRWRRGEGEWKMRR